ncbi:MAG: AtpZ/AtpI family protein [Bacteroidales bacterium]|nr:AtpZ/AtpI family protein [Bacteroidales bacterium]MBP5583724.1 AtpZ/AtpI family protein [Bacteroidales bacterium]
MKKNNINNFIKYTNIGIEMLAVILVGVFGGQKLDEVFENENQVFTIVCSLVAVFAAIYLAIKDFIKLGK